MGIAKRKSWTLVKICWALRETVSLIEKLLKLKVGIVAQTPSKGISASIQKLSKFKDTNNHLVCMYKLRIFKEKYIYNRRKICKDIIGLANIHSINFKYFMR
jgi:hypothetical protein